MIVINSGDRQIYNPKNPNLTLIDPKLTLEDNGAGGLTFKIYKSNLNYDSVKKLYPVISVFRNNKVIFKGRVTGEGKDFYNGKSVDVEGKMAFFNDSYVEPFSFSGAPGELFRMFVENHNTQVKDWQRFKVGVVTVKDPNDYIVRSSESLMNTWEALKSRCFQSSLGGHIRIRYEADGDYIDWISDYEEISSQSIEFAKNMLDLSITVDATETYTAIRPVGAEVDGNRIDISPVNNGKTYLINEEKADEYGIIFAPATESTWDDVTLPENLFKKAYEKLYNKFPALSETYEIRAVDLNLTDDCIEALDICEYIPVKSRMHGIDEKYLLNKADIFLAAPQNSVYYLGAVKRTFDVAVNVNTEPDVKIPKNISAFTNDAKFVSEEQAEELLTEYTKEDDVKEIVIQYIEQIPSGKDGADGMSAYEVAVNNGFSGTETEWLESLRGKNGEDGEKGEPGKDGADGITPVIKIGSVMTGEPGTKASVSISNASTTVEVILDFVIPKGDKGEPGSSGGTGTEEPGPNDSEELKIVTWADGTDEEIIAMIEAHYNGDINISNYWAVGDSRSISLSAMSATYVRESHNAQTQEFIIIGIEHDDLVEAVKGKTKAAITVQMKNVMDNTGCMNTSNSKTCEWGTSDRRNWCNEVFKNAIPAILSNNIKLVQKKYYYGKISNDYCFILHYVEMFAAKDGSSEAQDGTQYKYYQTASKVKHNKNNVASSYWTRKPYVSGNTKGFFYVSTNGSNVIGSGGYSYYGISPAFCI